MDQYTYAINVFAVMTNRRWVILQAGDWYYRSVNQQYIATITLAHFFIDVHSVLIVL